jgi:hypothetical protein
LRDFFFNFFLDFLDRVDFFQDPCDVELELELELELESEELELELEDDEGDAYSIRVLTGAVLGMGGKEVLS